jgi:integrase
MSLTTGSRQGELLGLEWRHVDFENKLAYLKETKNGRPRSISLANQVIEELKVLYQKRNPVKALVFASKTAFGRIDLKKAWNEALKRADIKDFRPHDLRHTFCTDHQSLFVERDRHKAERETSPRKIKSPSLPSLKPCR